MFLIENKTITGAISNGTDLQKLRHLSEFPSKKLRDVLVYVVSTDTGILLRDECVFQCVF